jgi:hypothetical protein
MPPPLPALTRSRAAAPEHPQRLAQGRLRDPELAGQLLSVGRRSSRCSRARLIPSRRFSIAASNVRDVRTGSTNTTADTITSGYGCCADAVRYSTVTVLARFRGWSTFIPRSLAMRYAISWSGMTASVACRNGCSAARR